MVRGLGGCHALGGGLLKVVTHLLHTLTSIFEVCLGVLARARSECSIAQRHWTRAQRHTDGCALTRKGFQEGVPVASPIGTSSSHCLATSAAVCGCSLYTATQSCPGEQSVLWVEEPVLCAISSGDSTATPSNSATPSESHRKRPDCNGHPNAGRQFRRLKRRHRYPRTNAE
jgi:hypothetical protein